MRLIVNGEPQTITVKTLSELLVTLDYEGDWLATAVNGELVHREDRADHALNDNDRIEILTPMQGG
ncbi:sulfur carrier protein ThiS [Agrobacterium sp. SHOUNA12C]|uniref:Sulfur transfer protein n=2 Tax=Rhizobium rhizogenes TaxID=359 RepID=B9JMX9_RHIR8|nr:MULTISPECIES: sulfur carrier protein ThiS [Rhizobium]ACM28910.1 sulfur transfer protein [Rhizobium rhizogenes K84]KAA6486206.1 sulfur carrier protein ThiS [Agrobacterium sp. ICMP 7243]MCJ9724046.1 sulfur carrier protein ThiS [Agrobacterium sp. BETTINA12B]MCJ9758144.1 sulfur carrier protein ThiS [Agrobacterium sp. SHOUNA12C]OCI93479.1 thiamine biosynthesis protein ThiS [Agrobacterium sp. 13-626]OCJ18835.1 thiamine biosynthesis protein ThiS [Agrobacterium sp. B131/95]OCJ20656.1 thiamine bio